MKKSFLIYCWLFFTSVLQAHPGIGIVMDSKGNIYYTDLKHVWKISIDGKKSVAVSNVHTHELYLDNHDNLFGEHLWYNGEKLDTWGHYVWQYNAQGGLDTVIPVTEGFREMFSFCQDSAGNMYHVRKFNTKSQVQKITPEGTLTILAEKEFKNIRWMYVSPGGVVYFIDLNDLYKIENGELKLMAASLQERTSVFEYTGLQHNIYGIWPDHSGNIYLAIMGGQVVKKVAQDGQVSDVLYTTGKWRPLSGLFDMDENLWLLEGGGINEVRARKISKTELAKKPDTLIKLKNKARTLLILAVILICLSLAVWFIFKKIRLRRITNKNPVAHFS